ncbi:hypothetical protein D1872_285310 [compost metagenome]
MNFGEQTGETRITRSGAIHEHHLLFDLVAHCRFLPFPLAQVKTKLGYRTAWRNFQFSFNFVRSRSQTLKQILRFRSNSEWLCTVQILPQCPQFSDGCLHQTNSFIRCPERDFSRNRQLTFPRGGWEIKRIIPIRHPRKHHFALIRHARE